MITTFMYASLLQSHSALSPASPEARSISHLWWAMFTVGSLVWLAVTAMALLVARRARRLASSEKQEGAVTTGGKAERSVPLASVIHGVPPVVPDTARRSMLNAVVASTAATTVILAAFLIYDFRVGQQLFASTEPGLTIEVYGHQWWWEFNYRDELHPNDRVSVANELHIPVGSRVRFLLNSPDVIHSLWLPNMNGKRDLVPGRQSVLMFKADTAGTYRGQCAEFCGLQHAKMALTLVAESPEAFGSWLVHQRENGATPGNDEAAQGRVLFESRSCSLCHTVRGTLAGSRVGPDLTHFGTRSTLASGAAPNTPENLAMWISSPDRIKPGTLMPPTPLTPAELRALTLYVESLR